MGNNLCKARVEQASDSKNPIDRVIGRCVQICPSSFAVKQDQNYWQKHVFETRPPQNNYPKPNEWHNATLKVSNDPEVNDSIDIPIAPPRRKRSSQIFLDDRPGGFKEVFGDLELPLQNDTAHQFETVFSNQRSVSSDEFADFAKDLNDQSPEKKNRALKHRISKVGNKKSDKFFGENLSDCLSDEPVKTTATIVTHSATAIDGLDDFVEKNVKPTTTSNQILDDSITEKILNEQIIVTPPRKEKSKMQSKSSTMMPTINNNTVADSQEHKDKSSSLNRRAEFLMTLLEGYNQEGYNTTPIRNTNSDSIIQDSLNKGSMSQGSSNQGLMSQGSINQGSVNQGWNQSSANQGSMNQGSMNSDSMNPIDESVIVPIRTHPKHICDDERILRKNLTSTFEKTCIDDHDSRNNSPNDCQTSKIERHVNFAIVPRENAQNSFSSNGETSPGIYAGMEPVNEPFIVPKRKIIKHVCHDDDALHNIFHPIDTPPPPPSVRNSSLKNQQNSEFQPSGPKKPVRDFEKYGKSFDFSNQIIVQKPMRKNRRSLSRDSLPNPPPRPDRKSEILRSDYPIMSTSDKQKKTTESPLKTAPKVPIKPKKNRRSISESNAWTNNEKDVSEAVPFPSLPTYTSNDSLSSDRENIETILRKCNSSQSFLTQDLMDDIVNKVSDFTMVWDDVESNSTEDFSTHVTPVSKVATRKISLSRLEREKEEAEQKKKNICLQNGMESSISRMESPEKPENQIKSTEDFLHFERRFAIELTNQHSHSQENWKNSRNNRKTGNVRVPKKILFQDSSTPLAPFEDSSSLDDEKPMRLDDSMALVLLPSESVETEISQGTMKPEALTPFPDSSSIDGDPPINLNDSMALVLFSSESVEPEVEDGNAESHHKSVRSKSSKDGKYEKKIDHRKNGIPSIVIKTSDSIISDNESEVLTTDDTKDDTSEQSDSSVITAINTADAELKNSFNKDTKTTEFKDAVEDKKTDSESIYQPMEVVRKGSIIDIDASLSNGDFMFEENSQSDNVKSHQFSTPNSPIIDSNSTADHSILMKFFDDTK